jgi:cytochrome c-type biogenesis protein CcmH
MRTVIVAGTFAALAALGAPRPAFADGGRHVDAPIESLSEYVPGASRVEGHLLAPCCWRTNGAQTLDVHGSPVASELRKEIRTRIKQGETPEAVEADLVGRYGAKILAVPPDSPLPRMGPILAIGLAGAGALAIGMIARWRRRSKESPPATAEPQPGAADEWDRRLDAELEDKD